MPESCWWIIKESNLGRGGYEPPALPIELMIRVVAWRLYQESNPEPVVTKHLFYR